MQHLSPKFKKSIILLQKFRSNFRILKHFKVPHKNEILKCVPVRNSTFIWLRFWRPGQFLKKKKITLNGQVPLICAQRTGYML